MTVEKVKIIACFGIITITAALIGVISVKYVIPTLLPFIIGWAVALAAARPSSFLSRKTKISVRILRAMLALIFVLGFLVASGVGIFAVIYEAWEFLSSATEKGDIGAFFEKAGRSLFGILSGLELGEEIKVGIKESLTALIGNAVSGLASYVSSLASRLPRIIFFIVVSAISTVYFAYDLERINTSIKRIMPKRVSLRLAQFKEKTLGIILKYIRAYFFIMLLTFALIFFGLTVLGVEYALLLAFIIALLDILPAIGVGVILIPAGALMLVYGNTPLGIGLLVLAAVCYTVRQIAEPKILGKNLGIHPLLTLVLMYCGYALFGIFGLMLLPVLGVVLVKTVFSASDEKCAAKVE